MSGLKILPFNLNYFKLISLAFIVLLSFNKAVSQDDKEKEKKLKEDAETVYQAYPRKVAKQNAIKAITKALKTTPLTQILDHLKLYSESVQGKETTFIPHCATYFNGGRHLEPVEIITKPSLFDITGKSVNL